jgi:predicted dehydrogenase
MSDRILNVAYIGNGKSANRYHAPFVLARPKKFRIKTMYARHIGHDTWAQIPGVCYTTNLDDVLGDPEVDVVEITTPSALHFEQARQVLLAGKNAVVDKPFCATEREARELFDLAAERGLTIECYQNRRFDSDFLTAQKVVASGRLGHVFEIVTSYDYWRPWMMAGKTLEQNRPIDGIGYGHATHCLDQLISWLGIPDRVHGELRQLQGRGMANDYFDFDLYYDDRNLKATAHANYMSAYLRPSFEVYGDRGSFVKFDKDQQERDLKHFYLPKGHDDFGLDSQEQWGQLRWQDDAGHMHEERVETVRSTYSQWYDALYETLVNGAEPLVKPEETIAQIRILEDAARQLA